MKPQDISTLKYQADDAKPEKRGQGKTKKEQHVRKRLYQLSSY